MDGVYQGTLDQKDVLPRPNEITNRSTIWSGKWLMNIIWMLAINWEKLAKVQ
jgi:hypothetical protein